MHKYWVLANVIIPYLHRISPHIEASINIIIDIFKLRKLTFCHCVIEWRMSKYGNVILIPNLDQIREDIFRFSAK